MPKSDHEIALEIKNGNATAYSFIIERYKDKGMSLAYRILNNRQDAEEALQDAFLRAFKALPKFEWKSSFSTWFYRILYNVCLSRVAKKKREYLENIEEIAETEIINHDNYPDTDTIFESSDFKEMLSSEMDKLDSIYSSILTLFYIQELSYTEIVNITGLPLGTIKNRLFRARNLLKDSILKHYQELQVK
jgi:RNA polymerase sigma factor (sigma-70 family)